MYSTKKIEELLELMSEHTENPSPFYPSYDEIDDKYREDILQPMTYLAMELVEKMLENEMEPMKVLKTFKLVICSHKNDDMHNLFCETIKNKIISTYLIKR